MTKRTYHLYPIYTIEQYNNHTATMPLLWVVNPNIAGKPVRKAGGHKPVRNQRPDKPVWIQFGYYSVRTHRWSAVQLQLQSFEYDPINIHIYTYHSRINLVTCNALTQKPKSKWRAGCTIIHNKCQWIIRINIHNISINCQATSRSISNQSWGMQLIDQYQSQSCMHTRRSMNNHKPILKSNIRSRTQ